MMCALFNGVSYTTNVSCYCPTNISDEMPIITFYSKLSSLVQNIPKHKVLIIDRDMNT